MQLCDGTHSPVMLALLLRHSVAVDTLDHDGKRCALSHHAQPCFPPTLCLLCSALHMAVLSDNIHAAKLLLDKHAHAGGAVHMHRDPADD